MTVEILARSENLLGAQVRGVDLRKPVSPQDVAAITQAINRHAVIVFPGQFITDEEQLVFSRQFGKLERRTSYARDKERIEHEEINDISNIDYENRLLTPGDRQRAMNDGNLLWHTDGTFKHIPSMLSMLHAREIPPEAGETEFADMRAAYDALPQKMKDELEDLIVEHSVYRSRSQVGFANFNDEVFARLPPVQQVMIRLHPGSGRKSLCLASHADYVIGWPVEKGRKLLQDLIVQATQPQFVYSHRWSVGDLVIWDNRCTMHRARPYDDLKHRRVMHRTTVQDIANTVELRYGKVPGLKSAQQ